MKEATVRPLAAGDRRDIERLLGRGVEFKKEEVACALELVDEALRNRGGEEEYRVLSAEVSGEGVVGFLCYGKTPLTQSTYDMYWIVVDPAHRGAGVGGKLLGALEAELRGRRAGLLVAETSSLPLYAQARAFYASKGFQEESRIRDFYSPGDDRLIYCKRLAES